MRLVHEVDNEQIRAKKRRLKEDLKLVA